MDRRERDAKELNNNVRTAGSNLKVESMMHRKHGKSHEGDFIDFYISSSLD
jgi:hypothetical protein